MPCLFQCPTEVDKNLVDSYYFADTHSEAYTLQQQDMFQLVRIEAYALEQDTFQLVRVEKNQSHLRRAFGNHLVKVLDFGCVDDCCCPVKQYGNEQGHTPPDQSAEPVKVQHGLWVNSNCPDKEI